MQLNIDIGKKALVTCDNWFYAPNGRQYRAAFGTIKAVRTAEDTLGVRPNGRSTNWYVEVGNMTIAGCQIHFVVRTDTCNTVGDVEDYASDAADGVKKFLRPNTIYNADQE